MIQEANQDKLCLKANNWKKENQDRLCSLEGLEFIQMIQEMLSSRALAYNYFG